MRKLANQKNSKFGSIRLFGLLAVMLTAAVIIGALSSWSASAERNNSSGGNLLGVRSSVSSRAAAPETVLINENFEGATTFLTANAAATNSWFIGTAAANGGTQGAYVTNDSGVSNAYTITTTSTNHLYAPITVPSGETAIVLSFDWKGIAEYDATTSDFDYLRVSVSTTLPVGGTFPANADQIPVRYSGQDNYTKAYVNLPAAIADGAPRFLIFTWRNDSSLGFQPPTAIDNVLLTSQVPAPLSGSKTIPGDYPSIGAAIAAVNANGADTSGGSLIFNVAAGSNFIETPTALTASGSSATNRIIFQKSGVGANPKVTAEGSGNFGPPAAGSLASTSDAVIALNGADFVTFDGIDIAINSVQAISPFSNIEYGYLIRNNTVLGATTTLNGAQNNIIQNTSITMDRRKTTTMAILQTASTANGAGSTSTSAATSNSGNKYYNLTIQNSYAGVFLIGTAAFPDDLSEVGVTGAVTQNTIGGPAANDMGNGTILTFGIRAASQSNAKIFRNEIRNFTNTGTTTVAGIHIDNAGTVTAVSLGTTEVYNNVIHDLSGVNAAAGVISGIRANLTGNATSVSRIYNNFVYGQNTTSTVATTRRLIGIVVQDAGVGTGATHNVQNNSVRIAPTGITASNTCFEIGGAAATNPVYNVQNNIFANFTGAQAATAKHYTWVSTSATSFGTGATSDFNDLYVDNTTNGFVGLGSTTDFATLANWQGMVAGTGPDDNSISANPLFASVTDLHLTTSSPPINTATTIAAITNDIDLQARPNGPAYDIGADEFYAAPGVLQLSSTTYGGSEGGTANATVNRVSGTSGTVGVTYTLTNGTATGGAACTAGVDYINPGPQLLSFGDSVGSQPITVTLCSDAVLDANETFTITLSLPTGGATLGSPTVATVTIQDIPPPFSGSFDIGTGQTYTSLTNPGGIFEAINLAGAAGNITLNISSNLAGETGAVALNQIAGGFTVLIKPSGAARTITGSSATGMITFNGTDFVTIDGSLAAGVDRSLTVTNSGAGGGIVFNTGTAGAQNNTIKNVNVWGGSATATIIGIAFGGNTFGTAGADNDNNRVENCDLRSSVYGIYSIGASAANKNTGLVITGNQMSQTGAARIGRIAIFIGFDDGGQITLNVINGMNSAETADAIGIGAGYQAIGGTIVTAPIDVTNVLISRNSIGFVNQTNTFSSGGICLGSGTSGTNTVVNNMIYGVTGNATSGDAVIGIYVTPVAGATQNIFHNSVSMTGSRGATAAQHASIALAISADQPINVRENILFNTQTQTGGGAGGRSYAIATTAATFANLVSDNNDLFVSGAQATLGMTGGLLNVAGTGTGVDRTDLLAWQTATGKDAASISADPLFTSLTDLHLLTGSPAINTGGTGVGVTTDFDGQTRDATPDIGADEFIVLVPGVLQLSSATYGVGEAAGNVLITVNRTGGTDGAVSVNYTLADISATGGAACTAGVDYINTGGTVNFSNGEASDTFNVGICNDALLESSETFTVTLSGPTGGATIGAQSSATVTITDDEVAQPGTLQFDMATYTVNEAAGTATATVNRTGGSDGTVGVTAATVAGGTATGGGACGGTVDYVTTSTPLSFGNGVTSQPFTFPICNDVLNEATESVNLALSAATGGATIGAQSTAVMNITDNDGQPSISITDVSQNEGNAGPTLFTFNVNLSAASGQTVTVHYQTADGTATLANNDYVQILDTTLTFDPGETTKPVTVTVNGDVSVEPNETFFVNLSTATNATISDNQGQGTIQNEDNVLPVITISDARVTEGNSGTVNAQFTVTLTGNQTGGPASVQFATANGTATASPSPTPGDDYNSTSGTLFFTAVDAAPDGSTPTVVRNVNVTVNGDTLKEANETFFVNLLNPVNATIADNQGVGIIVDDDRAYTSDVDHDRKSDYSVFRPSDGVWYSLQTTNGFTNYRFFGTNGDVPVPGDYDGDGTMDLAVFRPSTATWYIERSSDFGFVQRQWGISSDKPVQGDYDGDTKTDIAVFRDGAWYVLKSSDSTLLSQSFGQAGDRPVQGDYDGDAKTDYAVYRNGAWYLLRSTTGFYSTTFGLSTDRPVPNDYDGDGSYDIAVFRNGEWYILQTLTGTVRSVTWGTTGDVAVPADYDGDGTSDIAVFRSGAWYVIRSSDSAIQTQFWGTAGDLPVPSYYFAQ